MELNQIYRPIERELFDVNELLRKNLLSSKHKSILNINSYLLDAEGKRLRPALVLLSAKVSHQPSTINHRLTKIASAIELIHMASLIHDDVIDQASLRHHRPTINSRCGQDVSIALGDYLYSLAFDLIAQCQNTDILSCISQATKAMCEGELIQVCERDNLSLLRERYILIVKKKTASLFAVSCQAGAMISGATKSYEDALKQYGLNFGIAFQIVDDYLDLMGEQESTGKAPGQDIRVGEITLPLLNLFEFVPSKKRKELKMLLAEAKYKEVLHIIRETLSDSKAIDKTKEEVFSYVNLAKQNLDILPDSLYKESLLNIADFIYKRGFDDSC